MDWLRGRLIVVVGAAVLVVGAWWGLLRDGDGDAGGGRRGRLALHTGEILDLVPGCRRDTCRVVERRDGFRFEGRRSALLVVAHPESCAGRARATVHVVVPDEVRWSSGGELCGDPERGVARDDTGHAFLTFPAPGRGHRLVVLAVGAKRVEDFGSLAGRFDGRRVTADDRDGDGAREIVVEGRDGSTVWRWDGSEYTETRG